MLRVSPNMIVSGLLLWTSAIAALTGCATDASSAAPIDLGELPTVGKDDGTVVIEVPFAVDPATGRTAGETHITFVTRGMLSVTTEQDTAERLQLVAESDTLRRRSWRGRAPYLTILPEQTRTEGTEYDLAILNWGTTPASGVLKVELEPLPERGIEAFFNEPDCQECQDKAGNLRAGIIRVIQTAQHSIDLAIYGLDDPAILEALCQASEDGIAVRVVTDDTNEDPNDSRSYYPSTFSPETGLVHCGARVEPVRSSGLMHHKFMLVDQGQPTELVLTGSTNMTASGLALNHNHAIVIRGVPELIQSYVSEFTQLDTHCAVDRINTRTCAECTPACLEDKNEEGPWALPSGGTVEVLFSPTDDAMRVLRGDVRTVKLDAPDLACSEDDASCICRKSGTRFSCDYCAQSDDGWGLVGQASERIYMTMYSATDSCFALGLVRAHERGVDVRTVWDFVKSGSGYSRDDYLCANGIETWITNWGHGSAQVRNHNKTVVVDDVTFTGSMNLSDSGADQNNENTVVLRQQATADLFAKHVVDEIALLQVLGVTTRGPEACLCSDLVDNDGDGLADAADPDCDGARL